MKHLLKWSGGLVSGQPIPSTHPHLLPASSVVLPGEITRHELASRRMRLGELIGPDAVAVIPSYRRQFSSQNIFYRFRQSSNVLYLTGLIESDSVVVLRDGGHTCELFRKPQDDHELVWEGPRSDEGLLKTHFGFDAVHALDRLRPHLEAQKGQKLFAVVSENNDCVRLSDILPGKTYDLTTHLHNMRRIKSGAEVKIMRRAAAIAAGVYKQIMTKRFDSEKEVEDELEYLMRGHGASGLSYVPVVAGSTRSCVIHYTRNDQQLQSGQMVLVDAGAMYNNYCSDITRTWPVDQGNYSSAQQEIYEAVFNVQAKVLGALEHYASKLSLSNLHSIAYYETISQLSKLGFSDPKGQVDTVFPHSVGHLLGMDLHDCPSVEFDEPLKENMVITVEPGLYIPDSAVFPERYRGIGVRIEDDVLVTASGIDVLTADAPKLPSDIFK